MKLARSVALSLPLLFAGCSGATNETARGQEAKTQMEQNPAKLSAED
jgi:hypothetical protein